MQLNEFIYFVDLSDPVLCNNLIFTNSISSPSVAQFDSFNQDHPIYSVDLGDLKFSIGTLQNAFLSPRLVKVRLSYLSKQNIKLGMGIKNTKWFSQDSVESINRIADIEIEFEKMRRKIAPKLPSRLCSIYLAEDNLNGRIMLSKMFPNKRSFYITKVRISNLLRFHKADPRWISEFEKEAKPIFIENYWNGELFNDHNQVEYLLDGTIVIENACDREYIKNNSTDALNSIKSTME